LNDAAAAEVVKVLLPYCSNVNEPDPVTGHTALTYALSQSKLQAARALHAGGADVHHRLSYGTAAHVAAQFSSIAVLKWVQSVGVDLRAVNDGRELPLHYACNSNKLDAARHLLDLPGAAADVHALSLSKQTPLYYAAFTAADSVVPLLLQRGASVHVRCAGGSTPLMVAKTAPVMKLLLAADADAAAVTYAGSTVLHCCATFGATAGAICLLLKAGADPTAVDETGSTAAHVAGMKGHFALETLLSRAAGDYRKKLAAAATVRDSGSSSNNSSSSGTSSSSSNISSSSSGSSSSSDGNSSSNNNSSNDNNSSSKSGGNSSSAASTVTDDSSVDNATDSSAAAAGIDEHSRQEQHEGASHDAVLIEQKQQQQQQQSPAQKAKQPCANCSKLTSKRCRRCAAVHYCSVECQKVCFADAHHRAQCEAKAESFLA
jgi:ankyrin repeat protein